MLPPAAFIDAAIAFYILLGSQSWGYMLLRAGWPNIRALEKDYKKGWSMVVGFLLSVGLIGTSILISYFKLTPLSLTELLIVNCSAFFISALAILTIKRKIKGYGKIKVSIPKRIVAASVIAKKAFEKLPQKSYVKAPQVLASVSAPAQPSIVVETFESVSGSSKTPVQVSQAQPKPDEKKAEELKAQLLKKAPTSKGKLQSYTSHVRWHHEDHPLAPKKVEKRAEHVLWKHEEHQKIEKRMPGLDQKIGEQKYTEHVKWGHLEHQRVEKVSKTAQKAEPEIKPIPAQKVQTSAQENKNIFSFVGGIFSNRARAKTQPQKAVQKFAVRDLEDEISHRPKMLPAPQPQSKVLQPQVAKKTSEQKISQPHDTISPLPGIKPMPIAKMQKSAISEQKEGRQSQVDRIVTDLGKLFSKKERPTPVSSWSLRGPISKAAPRVERPKEQIVAPPIGTIFGKSEEQKKIERLRKLVEQMEFARPLESVKRETEKSLAMQKSVEVEEHRPSGERREVDDILSRIEKKKSAQEENSMMTSDQIREEVEKSRNFIKQNLKEQLVQERGSEETSVEKTMPKSAQLLKQLLSEK